MQLDDIDRHIVSCLVADGRASFREIGVVVGLSAPAVKRRVDRLRSAGVVTGFTARVDPSVLGWRMEAFVAVTYRGNVRPERIRTVLQAVPEVIAAYTVSGAADILVHLRTADSAHFEQALERLRASADVERTESTIVLSTLLERPAEVTG